MVLITKVSKCLKAFCFIFMLGTCSSTIYGQNNKISPFEDSINYYMALGNEVIYIDFDSALYHYNIAADFAVTNELWQSNSDVLIHKALSANHNFKVDSLRNYLTLLEQNLHNLHRDSIDYIYQVEIFTMRNWGSYYYKIGDLNRALSQFTELTQFIINKNYIDEYDYINLIPNYINIGSVHSLKGNQEEAIQYFKYAINTANELAEKYDPNYSDTYIYTYIANAYAKKDAYNRALYNYKKVNRFYKRNPQRGTKYKNRVLNNYNNISTIYLKKNQPDSALLYLNESLEYHVENDPFYAATWLNIGKAYTQKAEYEKAEEYISKSLKDTRNRYGEKHYKTAEIHLEKGNIYREKQDFEEALKNYQKSVISLTDKYNDTSIYSLPTNTGVNNKKELLQALKAKANTFYKLSLQNKNAENLEQANAHIQLTINVMDDMRREYSSEEARQFLVEQNEKSKSLSLLDALKNADAQQFANIPERTLEQERQLRTQINHLKGKISKLKKETQNEETLRDLQNELFEQQQQYDDFVAALETEYPDYHKLKYGQSIAGVDDIRRDMLTHDAVFVEYFMGDEQLYTFFITQNNIHVFSAKNTNQIQTNTSVLRQAIKDKNDTLYVQTAHFLYRNLLEKGLEKIDKNAERIIVVPDGGLAYIPFDILLENKIEDKQKNDKTEHDFAGFAPDFGYLSDTNIVMRSCHDARWSHLENTKKEVNTIRQLIGGKVFTETAATKDNFVNSGTKSRIIHLSTHACADEDDQLSRIYFNDDEYITALELYPLRLDADMVVLSACETGIGTLRRGEGVMSLARAFAYTGVPATTMSLWSVLDETTSKIMVNYYEHLKKSGITKDQALRLAKLDFLDKDVEKSQHQHPYYWAAFVHIGNAEPLTQGTNWWLWASLFVLVLGIVVVRQLRSI